MRKKTNFQIPFSKINLFMFKPLFFQTFAKCAEMQNQMAFSSRSTSNNFNNSDSELPNVIAFKVITRLKYFILKKKNWSYKLFVDNNM